MIDTCELSIVMPCLNEEKTLGACINNAKSFLDEHNISGEIIIADNGSTDNSVRIAKKLGAKVVSVTAKGYGSALMGGISASGGRYVIMGDSDLSYDFVNLMPYVKKLREGYDLVMGNRFKGGIKPGAMPLMHKYLGNPVLSYIGRLFFKTKVRDFHCGLRGFSRDAFNRWNMQTTGMEFASEIVVKAALMGMKITEVPTVLSPDGRDRAPHLRSFRDGFRHLQFLFMFSPRWLFLYPGTFMMILGTIISSFIFLSPESKWDVHTMLYASGSIMIGFQAAIFAVFSKTFAVHKKLLPSDTNIEKILHKASMKKGVTFSIVLIAMGLALGIYAVMIWNEGVFYELGITNTMRIVIASVTLMTLGFQMLFSSFFFNMLKLNTR